MVSIGLAAIVLGLSASVLYRVVYPAHPTDEALAERLLRHRAELDALAEMVRTDQLNQVTDDGEYQGQAQHTLAPERLALYRTRLRVVGVRLIVDRHDEGLLFMVNARGMATAGSYKGYVLSVDQPAPLVNSLDAPTQANSQHKTIYKAIVDHWYLYFQS